MVVARDREGLASSPHESLLTFEAVAQPGPAHPHPHHIIGNWGYVQHIVIRPMLHVTYFGLEVTQILQ